MRRYNRPLYRTARGILKDDAEAEDVLQDAYLLAFRNLAKFRGESSLSTWLTRIVVNEAIARARKTGRRAEIIQLGSEPEWDNGTAEASMNQPTPAQPEQIVQRAEVRRLIEKKNRWPAGGVPHRIHHAGTGRNDGRRNRSLP
jgi:RNA polymerase sigma-70 factor (ECF subfamily)